MIEILQKYNQGFISGVIVTIQLALVIWSVGIVAGTFIGWLANKYPKLFGHTVSLFGFLIASIPVIVILFWAHYPLQVLLGVVIDPFITAAWVLALVNTVAVSDIVRNALNNFPEEYLTAAKVCGLSGSQTAFSIRFPIIIRQITPALLTSQVVVLQSTLFASLISVEEILRVSQRINATAYKPVEIYSAVALFYVIICVPMNGVALYLKWRYSRNFSES